MHSFHRGGGRLSPPQLPGQPCKVVKEPDRPAARQPQPRPRYRHRRTHGGLVQGPRETRGPMGPSACPRMHRRLCVSGPPKRPFTVAFGTSRVGWAAGRGTSHSMVAVCGRDARCDALDSIPARPGRHSSWRSSCPETKRRTTWSPCGRSCRALGLPGLPFFLRERSVSDAKQDPFFGRPRVTLRDVHVSKRERAGDERVRLGRP